MKQEDHQQLSQHDGDGDGDGDGDDYLLLLAVVVLVVVSRCVVVVAVVVLVVLVRQRCNLLSHCMLNVCRRQENAISALCESIGTKLQILVSTRGFE